jgi:photosystem II stability/assembly factor-like uncharacterized protein
MSTASAPSTNESQPMNSTAPPRRRLPERTAWLIPPLLSLVLGVGVARADESIACAYVPQGTIEIEEHESCGASRCFESWSMRVGDVVLDLGAAPTSDHPKAPAVVARCRPGHVAVDIDGRAYIELAWDGERMLVAPAFARRLEELAKGPTGQVGVIQELERARAGLRDLGGRGREPLLHAELALAREHLAAGRIEQARSAYFISKEQVVAAAAEQLLLQLEERQPSPRHEAPASTPSTLAAAPPPTARDVCTMHVSAGAVFAAGWAGLWRSHDEGRTWQTLKLPPSQNLAGCQLAEHGGRIFMINTRDLLMSRDGGDSWSSTGPATYPGTIVVVPEEEGPFDSHVFALERLNGVFRSGFIADRLGSEWGAWNRGLPRSRPTYITPGSPEVERIAIGDPLIKDGKLFVVVPGPELLWRAGKLYVSASGGVYETTHAAREWRRTGSSIPDDERVVALAEDGGYFYAATSDRLYRSRDAARRFSAVAPPEGGWAAIRRLTFAGTHLFVVTDTAVWRSRPGGFTEVAELRNPRALAALGQRVVAVAEAGLYRSRDAGATWEPAANP